MSALPPPYISAGDFQLLQPQSLKVGSLFTSQGSEFSLEEARKPQLTSVLQPLASQTLGLGPTSAMADITTPKGSLVSLCPEKVHSFSPQMFPDCLPCARRCAKSRGDSEQKERFFLLPLEVNIKLNNYYCDAITWVNRVLQEYVTQVLALLGGLKRFPCGNVT